MTHAKKFHSINFILWMSFLSFAAFIILLTWVFQSTLLQVFFNAQTQRDLAAIGEGIYNDLKVLPISENNVLIDRYIRREQKENPAAQIFLLNGEGEVLYPMYTEEEETYELPDPPTYDTFAAVRGELYGQPENAGVTVQKADGDFVFLVKVGTLSGSVISEANDAYLYIDYSTEVASMAIGTMRVQLIMISIIVIFLALVLSALLSMKLTKPITQITKAAKRMAMGDFSVNFKGEYSYAEMDALAETLDYAKEEIGKSDELQKEVLANVTHDLKTPLTMIKSYACMIQEISGDNPEKRAKHTQVIIDESDRLTSLVNDILNLSKIRSGMDSLKITNFNLSEFVHTVCERFGYLSETQGYTIERDIEDELYTEADMEKIEQVVYNLIGNAVNYTGEDKKIKVGLKKEKDGVLRFTVTDTGKGIPPDQIDTIWDRYYRSSETHKRPIKGTGLGLSIVKTILQKHNFLFGVESEVGKGSTFYVLFPEK
ncbi:MAG TPA: HAMP domain-containing histidine kinase [Candidatus Borkfalkia excrementigallinarum]|uniref:histidine kinase n=1 Tax=Candidatus Borkfalkia excrementigallinarum TaxID=2838506 RepID=A0A9D1ZUU6_9FIRM|nr:HAMP domain-containing histidine kinase [Candidatus Borkfalkia excrementigallinarum]